jgi:O-antigen/teichoic acid export membrane protein
MAAQSPGTIDARGATGVGLASGLGALSGYLAMVVAARALDTQENTDFLTFWSLLFFLFGVLGGVQNEVTRAVGAASSATTRPAGSRVLPVGMAVGAGVAVLVLASSPLWGERVLGGSWPLLVVVVALAVTSFAGHSTVAGALSGERRWGLFARLVGSEALTRLVLVLLAGLIGSVEGLDVAAAAAALTWLVVCLVSRTARHAAGARGDVPWGGLVRNVSHSLGAAVGSSALLVGFAVILRLTSPADEFTHAAPLLLAISLTRAPLLVPLTAYQGVAITHFLQHRGEGLGALRRIVLLLAGGGAVAAVLAWLVGPWLMRVVFGEGYGVDGLVLAGLTVAAVMVALVTLTGAATLAVGRHRAYAGGWLSATAVAVLVLLTPLGLEERAVVALVVGPLVGATVHAVAIARSATDAR